jgi:CO/xanthine dehydrogenase FAD-binding subunit
VLRSSRGERVVPLDGFFLGPFHTAIEPDELLVAVRRPPLPAGHSGAYRSIEQAASGYAIAGAAAVGVRRRQGVARLRRSPASRSALPGEGRRGRAGWHGRVA